MSGTTFTAAQTLRTKCPLCGRLDGEAVWRENGHVARACTCGMLCVSPPPAAPPTAEQHAEGYYRFAARRRVREVLGFKRSGRFLDVGCGAGWLLRAARARGFSAEGLEPDAGRAAISRALGFAVREEFIERAQLSGCYDVVFNIDLLSHFEDPLLALRRMADGLAPGGVICLEVGIVAGISRGWYRLMGGLAIPPHRWFYSSRALEALFDKAGLEVRRARRFGLAPSACLVGLRKLLWPLLGAVVGPAVGPTGRQGRLHAFYDWVQYLLRYQLGAVLPGIGPQTAIFVLSRHG